MRRMLIYSHDSFGLGHLRRCRTIADDLVSRWPDLSILIISGSPVIGQFTYPKNVDFLRVPGVTKTEEGAYAPFDPDADIDTIISLRTAVIREAVEKFEPNLFLVDKEPLGLRGEVGPALEAAKKMGTRLVLGVRDVLDAPDRLQREWSRKSAFEALDRLYDDIWVYGDRRFYDPLQGLLLPAGIREKASYTGYLRRPSLDPVSAPPAPPFKDPFVLVMAGGGGDGGPLIEWTLETYERRNHGLPPALIVTGPFLPPQDQQRARDRVAQDSRLKLKTFDAEIEFLQAQAAAWVTMGGYNTFCEVLSRNKPCVMVPRTKPRQEQLIRASRAAELGLVTCLLHWTESGQDMTGANALGQALSGLDRLSAPDAQMWPHMMDGLDGIATLADPWIGPNSIARTPIRSVG